MEKGKTGGLILLGFLVVLAMGYVFAAVGDSLLNETNTDSNLQYDNNSTQNQTDQNQTNQNQTNQTNNNQSQKMNYGKCVSQCAKEQNKCFKLASDEFKNCSKNAYPLGIITQTITDPETNITKNITTKNKTIIRDELKACQNNYKIAKNTCKESFKSCKDICKPYSCNSKQIFANGTCMKGCYNDKPCNKIKEKCNANTLCLSPPGCQNNSTQNCIDVCYGYCESVPKSLPNNTRNSNQNENANQDQGNSKK